MMHLAPDDLKAIGGVVAEIVEKKLENVATKDDLKDFATKEDLK